MNTNQSLSLDKEDTSEGEESALQGLDDEVVTVGQSDTQDDTSGGSDNEVTQPRMNESRKGAHKLIQIHVKDSWEDDSIINGEEETSRDGSTNQNRDGGHEETQAHTESTMDKEDREYEPTTTDSEESAVSIKRRKSISKKQTTITNTFHLTKRELETMTQMKGNTAQIVHKRQTRSMRTHTK